MHNPVVLLIAVALLAYASTRSPGKASPERFQHLRGWHKVFGVLAIILAFLILLNPDFLALGLFGDTAFFDLLVFALSLQMSVLVAQAFQVSARVFSKAATFLGISRMSLRLLLAMLALNLAAASTAIQKAVHRIFS